MITKEMIQQSELGAIKKALERGSDPNQEISHVKIEWGTHHWKHTLLTYALMIKQFAVVELLLLHHADPNKLCMHHKDFEGFQSASYSPLHYAVQTQDKDIVKLLLKAGANPFYFGHERFEAYNEDINLKLASGYRKLSLTNYHTTTAITKMIQQERSQSNLKDYINSRERDGREYKTTLFGYEFGDSRTEKLAAAHQLQSVISGKAEPSTLKAYLGPLTQFGSELKKVYESCEESFTEVARRKIR